MRSKEEIMKEIKKVIKADKAAERKQMRCEARLIELDEELELATGEAAPEELEPDVDWGNQVEITPVKVKSAPADFADLEEKK